MKAGQIHHPQEAINGFFMSISISVLDQNTPSTNPTTATTNYPQIFFGNV
ncbi:MAG: hypothetical protein ACJAU0_000808 [Flavobacteriales bacterium]|jgi:hypothetical protein